MNSWINKQFVISLQEARCNFTSTGIPIESILWWSIIMGLSLFILIHSFKIIRRFSCFKVARLDLCWKLFFCTWRNLTDDAGFKWKTYRNVYICQGHWTKSMWNAILFVNGWWNWDNVRLRTTSRVFVFVSSSSSSSSSSSFILFRLGHVRYFCQLFHFYFVITYHILSSANSLFIVLLQPLFCLFFFRAKPWMNSWTFLESIKTKLAI